MGWHDHLQYHLFFEGLFVQARVFLTPSLEQHSLWIYDHAEQKLVELVNSSERMQQADGDYLDLTGPRLHIHDGSGGGVIRLAAEGSVNQTSGESRPELEVEFVNKNVFSWLPSGHTDAVIHRPDLEVTLRYKGQTHHGRGYSKRYY